MPTDETMSEGEPMPPMPGEAHDKGANMKEMCVSLDALSMPDDQDQMQPPSVGDQVDFSVSGKVTKIEGKTACVMPTMVNGKAVEDKSDTPPAPSDSDQYAQLEQMAAGQPPTQ